MNKAIITKSQLRKFGLLIGLGLPIIIGWIFPYIGGHDFRIWTLYFGIPLLIIGIINPLLLFYPYKLWMKIGNGLGWLNSHIILGVVFIFVLQPISLIMRIFNHDPLRKKKLNRNSYKERTDNKTIDLSKIF